MIKYQYIEKPWGSERILLHHPRFWIKILYIRKGHQTSTQYHHKRTELHIATTGLAFYKPTQIHTGKPGLCLEFAWGEPHDEDIVRITDPYGR